MQIGVGIDYIGGADGSGQQATLGKIFIYDKGGLLFNDLISALAYVQQFTGADITNQSFFDETFYFSVAAGTDFSLSSNFCDNLDGYFSDSAGLISFYGSQAFINTKGNNIIGNDVTFGDDAFIKSSGNNIIGNCFFGDFAFFQSVGNNKLGDCLFTESAFYESVGNNVLGNCNFSNYAFTNEQGNNILGNCEFISNAFFGALGNNILGNCNFATNAFRAVEGNNILGNCIFNNNAFMSASGNNYMKRCSFNHDAFNGASPTIKNSVEELVFCQTQFAKEYTGRFDILISLGNNPGADLPADIFVTANLVWIHAPESMKYNNGGAIDGDLAVINANLTNPNKTIIYT